MKIGIDARMLGMGYGIGRYVEQLIQHLELIDHENQYVLFVNSRSSSPYQGEMKRGSAKEINAYPIERPHLTSPFG